MKVLELISSLNHRAGAEVFVYSLSQAFIKDGICDVKLVSLYSDVDDSFAKKDGIPVASCKKRKGIDIQAANRLKKIIKEYKPDVIHMHLNCLLTYYLAFGFKKHKWEIYQTIHTIPGKESNLFNNYLRKRYIKKGFYHLVAISKQLAIKMASIYKIAPLFVNNGLVLKKPKINPKLVKYDFCIVASFTEAKNHKLLFDAIEELNNEQECSLLCVGGGPLLADAKKYIDSKELSKQVTFIGDVSDVYPYLLSSKVFVLSSNREGNPISLLEALDCGLPVVVPNIGGIPDVVDDSNGCIYEVSNKKALIDGMKRIINLVSKSNIYEATNKERSLSFSIDVTAKSYYMLFLNKGEKPHDPK